MRDSAGRGGVKAATTSFIQSRRSRKVLAMALTAEYGVANVSFMCALTTMAIAMERTLEGQVVQRGDEFCKQIHNRLGQY